MSRQSHTADWSVSAVRVTMDGQKWLRIVDGASRTGSREIAFVPFGDRTPEEYRLCTAEARLIAAAPELLEALNGCLPQLELGNGEAAHIKAAHAAIQKATGESA